MGWKTLIVGLLPPMPGANILKTSTYPGTTAMLQRLLVGEFVFADFLEVFRITAPMAFVSISTIWTQAKGPPSFCFMDFRRQALPGDIKFRS